MNIRDLKYLVTVAKLKHFGRAADACFVSQPTLSTQLKKLEQEWDVQLFERNNKQVILTPAGEQLIEQAIIVLREVDALNLLAKGQRDPLAGPLKIGIIPTIAPYLLPIIMPALTKALPDTEFFLIEDKTESLLTTIRTGGVDAIILAEPYPQDTLCTEILYDEPFYIALHHQHPLANATQLELEALASETVLLLDEGHCFRDSTLELCQQHHLSEQSGFRGTSLETLKYMVASGNGITFLPALMDVSSTLPPEIKLIRIAPSSPIRRISIAWRKRSPKEACLRIITDIIHEHLHTALKDVNA